MSYWAEVFLLDSDYWGQTHQEKVPASSWSVKTATVKAHLWGWVEGRDPWPDTGRFCWAVNNRWLIQLENKWGHRWPAELALRPYCLHFLPNTRLFLYHSSLDHCSLGFDFWVWKDRKKKLINKDALLSAQLSTFVPYDSQTHMWKTLVFAGSLQVCRTVVPGGSGRIPWHESVG